MQTSQNDSFWIIWTILWNIVIQNCEFSVRDIYADFLNNSFGILRENILMEDQQMLSRGVILIANQLIVG